VSEFIGAKSLFCYFFAAVGNKVEDIKAKMLRLALQLFFWQDQTHQVRKIGSAKTLHFSLFTFHFSFFIFHFSLFIFHFSLN
jgi:hypothetical protein